MSSMFRMDLKTENQFFQNLLNIYSSIGGIVSTLHLGIDEELTESLWVRVKGEGDTVVGVCYRPTTWSGKPSR